MTDMNGRLSDYEALKRGTPGGGWAARALSEMGYLLEVSRAEGCRHDARLLPAIRKLRKTYDENGAITKADVLETEAALAPLREAAKAYEVTCVSHAHIDMNWLWGYGETALLTVDTFRTMLQLLKEYPDFIFSQSQASTYRIIEEYAPEMLPEIRRFVLEGRWEVTASSWVENDKNMPCGEAMTRQLLYTKRYLSRLLSIDEDSLSIDMEPDTFGHAGTLPEILQSGGVKYYYFCRGYDKENIFRWEAPSGARVLAYREPKWYTLSIDPALFAHVPGFCAENGVKAYLKVYGVGDHGGGPTRRDIERILDMATWPLFPRIRFGTLKSYFERLENSGAAFPVVRGELNYVFTGCYTSQARIKRANRMGEDRLCEAETLDAAAFALCAAPKPASPFEPAWRRVLFNQFHDILPGSGLTDTREYAMGEFQQAMATASVNASAAMRRLSDAIDTSSLLCESDASDTAPGAGVGYGCRDALGFRFHCAERGSGTRRVYTLFNPTAYDREDVAELMVWDWPEDISHAVLSLPDGTPLETAVLENDTPWWGHRYAKLAVCAPVPGLGYQSVVLSSRCPEAVATAEYPYPRRDDITDAPIVLENERLRAVFTPGDMRLISLIDKPAARELIDEKRPACGFELVTEATATQMTGGGGPEEMSAWRVGRAAKVERLNETCPVTVTKVERGGIRQSIAYTLPFGRSTLSAKVILDKGADILRFELFVVWRELGSKAAGVPNLRFTLPLNARAENALSAVPFGMAQRPALYQDVPANGMISATFGTRALSLLSDCKYGFRNDGDTLYVSLIRASYNPDTAPEIGNHTIALGVLVSGADIPALCRANDQFAHPVHAATNTAHRGSLPFSGRLARAEGAMLTCVKRAEEGGRIVFRLCNPTGETRAARLTLCRPIREAALLSATERTLSSLPFEGREVSLTLAPYTVAAIGVTI